MAAPPAQPQPHAAPSRSGHSRQSYRGAAGAAGFVTDGAVEERHLWRQVQCQGQIPSGRIGHSVCNAGNGILYLWGGVNESCEAERCSRYLEDFYRYDFHRKEWTQVELTGQPPTGRAFHSAVMHRGKVIIFGGCNGRGRFNRISRIDGETGVCEEVQSISGELPATRYCHTAVEYQGRMLVFGGKCGGRNSNRRLADMFSFSFDSKEWSVVEPKGEAPSSRSAHTSVIYGNKMLMFGGRDGEGRCCEDFYEFHLDTTVWRKLDCQQSLLMRARHSAVVHNDSLVIFGGWSGKKKLNDLCIYNLDTGRLKQVHDNDENDTKLPCRRECHCAVVVDNTMMLFGGRFRGVFMNDSYEYPLQPPALKLLLRQQILSGGIPYAEPEIGLPPDLIAYIRDYKVKFLDSPSPHEIAAAGAAAATRDPGPASGGDASGGDGGEDEDSG
eukprot:TRINITY_DN15915_c0_g2_i1.p1 TRINITY_DN15915_c0_g2~~TRINITY_DN15915_c0_g2_i1.p1  ORF type:complete len:441 (+),score=133.26 TRINITY_DN15915_c0_g2_i1:121-1443(+)